MLVFMLVVLILFTIVMEAVKALNMAYKIDLLGMMSSEWCMLKNI